MQTPSAPIIVTVVEENELSALGEVMLRAVGLTGVLTIGALVFGLVLAAVFIGYRRLTDRLRSDEQSSQTQSLGLTPTGKP